MNFSHTQIILSPDYCNETPIANNQLTKNYEEITLYKILCPPLILACLISVTLNMGLYLLGTFGTHNKSPVLVLSLNLATTDTIASLLNGIGFIFNSYLPVVFDVHFDTCPFLALEVIRISAFISSVLHLLALAFIHYNGTVRPLDYRVKACCSPHVTRSIHLITFVCWLIPLMTLLFYFSSIPCQGFQSATCEYHFLASKRFRYFMLIFFLLPLIMMLFLYIRIFLIIRRNQKLRQKSHSSFNMDNSPKILFTSKHLRSNGHSSQPPHPLSAHHHAILIGSHGKISLSSSPSSPLQLSSSPSTESASGTKPIVILRNMRLFRQNFSSDLSVDYDMTTEHEMASECRNPSPKSTNTEVTTINPSPIRSDSYRKSVLSSIQRQREALHRCYSSVDCEPKTAEARNQVPTNRYITNTRGLITSLLILGTYLICWVPALILLVLTCIDGCPFPLTEIPKPILISTSFICNFLVILKAIVDPFIYTLRSKEVRLAVKRFINPPQNSRLDQ